MTAMIKPNPQLPAAIQRLMGLATPEAMNELSGGVTSGFPIVGYKGKVWRLREKGGEKLHVDADGNAMPTIDVVLVQANPMPSKIFYDKKFEEGTNEPPRCFSNDGGKPDPSVQNPISPNCANCPNNVWGSRITDNGKKSRACSDARRMAVVFAQDLYENGEDCQKFLLRVPPASLNPLKDYAEKVLSPKGIPFFGIVTRIGFDVTAAHPQFIFKPARFLNDEEAEAIVKLRGSEDVKRILAEAQEFPAGAAGGEADDSSPAPATAAGSAPPAASAPTTAPAGSKKGAMRPASDEEAGIAAATPPAKAAATPPAKAAAPAAPPPAPAQQPVEGEVMSAPPPRKKKPAAAAPAPAPAPAAAAQAEEVEEETAPPPAPAKAGGVAPPADFDNLLDTILNG
jgi:hypothetical protein